MLIEKYDYNLPKELIAQKPAEPRDSSRLMVIKETIEHKHFYEILNYMEKGDTIVFNNSRVIRARVKGIKNTGGKVELLFLSYDKDPDILVKGKNIKPGTEIIINDIRGVVREKNEGICKIDFNADIHEIIEKYGEVPLPPYIKEHLENGERYQTIFSKIQGSVAAPTAGLHFTENLLNKIQEKGIRILFITLHISYSTFKPLDEKEIIEGKLHEEYYQIPEDTANSINKREGRLFAVGTTVVRALESSCSEDGKIISGAFKTDLFIKEGYKFKSGIDALITNFHIPKSSLLMLVTSFGEYERIMNAYKIAVENRYRFYSFGDAMLIFKK
ncbi:MAG: tRNA preQ1(34) S-adenosylmethionine ribosyltransferase-isomerase QueA [Thermoplasmata archaeon]|nr:tRNA preQ1(34) S-adenosylmethionine ribosyltransferase-isomerase QueA [Thermoplasmata archaeon]